MSSIKKHSLATFPEHIVKLLFSFCTASALSAASATCYQLRFWAQKEIVKAKIKHQVIKPKNVTGEDNGSVRYIHTQCPVCKSNFHNKSELKSHVKRSKECRLPYECPRCEHSFFSKNQRVQHMRTKNHLWTEQELEEKKKKHDAGLPLQKEREQLYEGQKKKKSENKNGMKSNTIITLGNLKLGEEIGEGPGLIYEGTLCGDTVMVTKIKAAPKDAALFLKKRAPILKNIARSAFLVHFIGGCPGGKYFLLVNEMVEGESLHEILHSQNRTLSVDTIRTIALDVAKGMRALHSNNPPILHCDLRSVNILVDKENRAKVSHYGITSLFPANLHQDAFRYMPAEVTNEAFTEKVDVYSFGMVLYEMATGKVPFGNFNSFRIAEMLAKRRRLSLRDAMIPPYLKRLIRKCWDYDPFCRPRFKKIIKHLESPEPDISSEDEDDEDL